MMVKSVLTLILAVTTNLLFAQLSYYDQMIVSYQHPFKLKEKKQIIINLQDSIVRYRKKPYGYAKIYEKNIDVSFFTDSIDFKLLDSILIHSSWRHVDTSHYSCQIDGKGSLKIALLKGSRGNNTQRVYEFGRAINCRNEENLQLVKSIRREYFRLRDEIF